MAFHPITLGFLLIRNQRRAGLFFDGDGEALFHQFAAGDFGRFGGVEIRHRVGCVGFQSGELQEFRLFAVARAAERLHDALALLGPVELPRHPDVVRRAVGRERIIIAFEDDAAGRNATGRSACDAGCNRPSGVRSQQEVKLGPIWLRKM